MSRNNPIIVALDVPSAQEALELVECIGDGAGMYKVGMELYAAAGPDLVRELRARRREVFLDMKFYDIPETVRRATAQVARLDVQLLTVHGSRAVMRAAVEGKGGSALGLLAVTVLTSFDEDDLADLGYPCAAAELVKLRVRKAKEAGVDGVVCSPLEVAAVREAMGPHAVLVTPGVRSAGAGAGDQKRVATPAEAMRGGATFVVIGRQITRAPDPAAEARRVLAELKSG